jgi:hypothetical protein
MVVAFEGLPQTRLMQPRLGTTALLSVEVPDGEKDLLTG